MKKVLCFLFCVLLMTLYGCTNNQQSVLESSTPTTESPFTSEIPDTDISLMQIYMEDLVGGLYDCETSVYELNGGFAIRITMEAVINEVTFADFVIDGTQTLRQKLKEFDAPLHEFTILFTVNNPNSPNKNGSMLWTSTDLNTGMLSDNSYGRNYFLPTATLEDIDRLYEHTIDIEE